jgi:hypothetical protein
MSNKFVSVMDAIGRDFEKGLIEAEKYLPEAASLAAVIYPPSAAVDASVISGVGLVQKAVTVVEQKYAASGVATGSGPQKLAEVMSLTDAAVTSLLAQYGIVADSAYITNLVNAVVAILNVQAAPTVSATGTPAAPAPGTPVS